MPWMSWVLGANGVVLVLRLTQRFYFTSRLYVREQHGLLSGPHVFVSNVVNCAAAARACRMFLAHLLLGKRLVWDETMHAFPSQEAPRCDGGPASRPR